MNANKIIGHIAGLLYAIVLLAAVAGHSAFVLAGAMVAAAAVAALIAVTAQENNATEVAKLVAHVALALLLTALWSAASVLALEAAGVL